jgi:T5SS/PEP-CTERM-associated repeat protein
LPGSQGTVIVSGAGATWTNIGNVVVGGLGTGTLTIQNGGTVNSAGGGSVGLAVGSTGTVTVTGPGSGWFIGPGGGLNIGSFGTGTLVIANGGTVFNFTASAANIGNGPGSQGTVTVTGAGSSWINSSGVNIGDERRLDWNTQHRRGRGTRHAHCAERRIWRWHRYAQLQSHVY